MKVLSFFLIGIASFLFVIGLVLFLRSKKDRRDYVLSNLEKARKVKAKMRKDDEKDFLDSLNQENVDLSNLNDFENGGKK